MLGLGLHLPQNIIQSMRGLVRLLECTNAQSHLCLGWYISHYLSKQEMLRQVYISVQSHQSLWCSHTQCRDIDEGSDQKFKPLAPPKSHTCMLKNDFMHNVITGLQIKVCNQKIIFLILNQNICCGYSKEPSHWENSFEYPWLTFKLKDKKIITILCTEIC